MIGTLSWSARAALFYVMTIGLAIAVAVVVPVGDLLFVATMFTPLAAVLTMLLVVTRDGWSADGWNQLGVTRLGFRLWPVAVILPLLILLLAYGSGWALGVGRAALPSVALWPAALNLVVAIAFSCVWAAGEELGWRGYLQPALQPLGALPAMLLTGFLHGCWHLPLVFLANVYITEGSRWITVPVFLALVTVAGVLFGYLRVVTGSVWPAVIAHGAFNTFLALLGSWTVDGSPALPYLVGETGILTLAVALAAAIWLARRLRYVGRPESNDVGAVVVPAAALPSS